MKLNGYDRHTRQVQHDIKQFKKIAETWFELTLNKKYIIWQTYASSDGSDLVYDMLGSMSIAYRDTFGENIRKKMLATSNPDQIIFCIELYKFVNSKVFRDSFFSKNEQEKFTEACSGKLAKTTNAKSFQAVLSYYLDSVLPEDRLVALNAILNKKRVGPNANSDNKKIVLVILKQIDQIITSRFYAYHPEDDQLYDELQNNFEQIIIDYEDQTIVEAAVATFEELPRKRGQNRFELKKRLFKIIERKILTAPQPNPKLFEKYKRYLKDNQFARENNLPLLYNSDPRMLKKIEAVWMASDNASEITEAMDLHLSMTVPSSRVAYAMATKLEKYLSSSEPLRLYKELYKNNLTPQHKRANIPVYYRVLSSNQYDAYVKRPVTGFLIDAIEHLSSDQQMAQIPKLLRIAKAPKLPSLERVRVAARVKIILETNEKHFKKWAGKKEIKPLYELSGILDAMATSHLNVSLQYVEIFQKFYRARNTSYLLSAIEIHRLSPIKAAQPYRRAFLDNQNNYDKESSKALAQGYYDVVNQLPQDHLEIEYAALEKLVLKLTNPNLKAELIKVASSLLRRFSLEDLLQRYHQSASEFKLPILDAILSKPKIKISTEQVKQINQLLIAAAQDPSNPELRGRAIQAYFYFLKGNQETLSPEKVKPILPALRQAITLSTQAGISSYYLRDIRNHNRPVKIKRK